MSRALKIFERQVLVFPALTTLLACVSFLLGGHCAAWQWWIAGLIVVTLGFRQNWRDGACAAAVFAMFLGVLWCVNHTMLTRTCVDVAVYHMPATRALIAGWNPVEVSTPEDVASFLGVTVNDARFWMVVSMAKTAWVFNAVAAFFTGDQTNLFFPVLYFFFTALSLRIWSVFRHCSVLARILMIVAAFVMLPPYNMPVDVAIAVSGIGLLIGFWDVLRGNKPDWISLTVFSFWMTTAKQLGALHCCVMWCVFAVLYLRNWKRFRECAIFAFALMVLWFVVTISPYVTNYRNYGHPFYPCYTVDETKFPTVDLVQDFKDQNGDAAEMGAVGRFVNSYISSDLACAYYSLKTGRKYNPQARFFSYNNDAAAPNTPTRPWVKIAFCGLLFLIMWLGRKHDRFAYMVSFFALCAVPTLMIGYVRYTPWMFWPVLPLIVIFDEFKVKWFRVFGLWVVALVVLPGFLHSVVNGAILVDYRYAANKTLSEMRISCATPVLHRTEDGVLRTIATLKGAARSYGVGVESLELRDGRINFYTDEFQVRDLPDYSVARRILNCPDRRRRMLMYGNLVVTSIWKFILLLA